MDGRVVIKGLLIGFGFLIVATLVAIGLVRYANTLPDSRRRGEDHDDRDTGGRDGH